MDKRYFLSCVKRKELEIMAEWVNKRRKKEERIDALEEEQNEARFQYLIQQKRGVKSVRKRFQKQML